MTVMYKPEEKEYIGNMFAANASNYRKDCALAAPSLLRIERELFLAVKDIDNVRNAFNARIKKLSTQIDALPSPNKNTEKLKSALKTALALFMQPLIF